MATKLNTNTSIVDYLKSIGEDSSYAARKELAQSNGITNYYGSDSQNTQLLDMLKNSASTNTITETNNNKSNIVETKDEVKDSKDTDTSDADAKLLGVDDETLNKMNSTFESSWDVKESEKVKGDALSNLKGIVSKEDIISDDVMYAINSSFVVPKAVKEADAYLSEQLDKIQSGKTSYSDQVKDMMDKIMNREKFSYDVDTDPLFQQALASAMNSGKTAMQDTIGQASALTGGYGSTYATTAGNQAYNAFIEDAYDNLPQYYQMAMEAYQMEGDEMYRQFSMLSEADDKEFNRYVTAYDATSQYRNRMYDEAYNSYRDSISDAFATANLQIAEHGQRVSDAYNYYNAASNYSDTLYEREYNKWSDEVSMAYKYAELLNSDYWSQTNFDEGVRQYEQTFAEDVRQYETSLAEQKRQYNESLAEQKRQHDEQMAYNYTALNQKGSSGGGGGGGGGGNKKKSATESQMKKALDAYNKEGMAGLNKYLNSIPDDYDKDSIAMYVGEYGTLPYSQRTYTVIYDGGTNWGGGIDNNATVKDQYGNKYTLKQLSEYDKDIALELSDKKYTKGKSYTKK